MTFTQKIYEQVSALSYISTDEFSTDWLGQSRSYYYQTKHVVLKQVSVLVCLMNKLTEQERGINENNPD